MKKSLRNLELKKQTISNLNLTKVKGGAGTTVIHCDNTGIVGLDTKPLCEER
ncbi:hypothetical protein ACWGOQ_0000520 [Aquimarina sp. M1]